MMCEIHHPITIRTKGLLLLFTPSTNFLLHLFSYNFTKMKGERGFLPWGYSKNL
jgi:hypothetical protein